MLFPKSKTPPQPRGNPFIGNLRGFLKEPLTFLLQSSEALGDIVKFKVGKVNLWLLNDTEAIEQVLIKNSSNYIRDRGYRILKDIFGNGLITSEGEFWLKQRRMMQPAFHKEHIANYAETVVLYSRHLVDSWKDSEVRVLQDEMMQLTLKIIIKCLFGLEMSKDAKQVIHSFESVVPQLERLIENPLIRPWWPSLLKRHYLKGKIALEKVTTQIIREKREAQKQGNDLLSMLLLLQDDEGKGMTDKQLRDEVLTLMLAGHETTALLLVYVLYLVGKSPEVEAKILEEIDRILNNNPVTLEDLKNFSYTEKVIKETLRLYPSVPLITRTAQSRDYIKGFVANKNTQMIMTSYVTQRKKQYYEEPESFKPERWTPEFINSLPQFAYFPFGGGGHFCIGRDLALLETKLILISLLQHYRIEVLNKAPLKVRINITLRPTEDIFIKLHKR